ncbi:NAD(P)-dependent oxidoreductase [Mycobacterium sp. 050272]|uniref:NAD(P)-dependent oxidoreductase n=1 Tax=Mycobacterium sp. 050272 TaxID=3142488 RepID=UPI003187FA21
MSRSRAVLRKEPPMPTIGFIGAGQLGEPMVKRLLAAGHPVNVYARRSDVRSRLADRGAVVAESVAGLAADSDILISCLFSDAQLRETGLGPEGFIANAKPGAVFVSHTTGSAATLTELANSAASAQAILDAPVSGTADHIAAGTLTVLVGGCGDDVERVRPILAAYANPIIATGELGSALRIKLINNMLFAANAQLLAAAAQIGEQLGIAPYAFLDALLACSGSSSAATYAKGIGGLGSFAEAAAPFLAKDVAVAVTAAEQAGADLGLLQAVVTEGPLDLTTNR